MPVDRPTFSESWYRVAELRPRLRPTVQIRRQHFRGQMWHVVQDPSNNQFFRLNDAAYRFIALLDGKRSVAEAWKICNEQLGDNAPTQGEAIQLMGQLYVSNLLLSEVSPDAEGLFKRYRKRVRREVQGYMMNLLFIRIPLLDPDHFLNRWVGVVGKAFSVAGAMLWLLLLAAGLYSVTGHFGDLFKAGGVMGEGILSPENLPVLYLCFVLVKVMHELGHAFTCKRFGVQEGSGGEVHVMGIMFLVFTPFPYVDASSSWAFRSKWHRAVVGAAGVLVELAIASVAAIIWANTAQNVLAHKLAYNVMFIAGVSTILFNGNPLLRYDGYYILSDLLEIPNLAQRSKDYLYYLVRKYLWSVRQARNPSHSRGERAWMIAYGISSTIYRVFICVAILLFVADALPTLGVVLASAAVIAWLMVPLGKFIHYLATSTELMRHRIRAVTMVIGLIVVLVGGLGMIPVPDHCRVEGIVQPDTMAMVNTETAGFIRTVIPTDQKVTPQTVLLTAENRELLANRNQMEAERLRLEADRRLNETVAHWKALDDDAQIASLDRELALANKRLDQLNLKSPISGTWISPDAANYGGAYLEQGKPVGMVADLDHLIVRAIAGQDVSLSDVLPDVDIRIKGRPEGEVKGKIVRILPAAREDLPSPSLSIAAGGEHETAPDDKNGTKSTERFFEVRITPDQIGPLMAGQRVVVRMRMPNTPLALQWWHSIEQMVQKRFHI